MSGMLMDRMKGILVCCVALLATALAVQPVAARTQLKPPKTPPSEQSFASDLPISQRINQIVQKNLPTANVGVLFMDGYTGKVLHQVNGNKLFNPASNAKLFVSAAALYYLGPDFTYKTTISTDPRALAQASILGDVTVKFSGDPSLKSQDVTDLIRHLSNSGIKKIYGNIIIDDSEFEPPNMPSGYSIDDITAYYAAPVSSVIIDSNIVAISIKPGLRNGDLAIIAPRPQDSWVKILNSVKTVKGNVDRKHCELYTEVNYRNVIEVSGCWPAEKGQDAKVIALNNPAVKAAVLIRNALTKNDIYLSGKIVTGKAKDGAQILAQHSSAPLLELIRPILKKSNNLYADAVFKTLGKKRNQEGSFIEGANAVEGILRDSAHVDVESIRITDGSGSRYNLVSPQMIGQLLFSAFHSAKIRDQYLGAFSIARKDGTLRGRFFQNKLPSKIIAKTGTMHDVSALSGYFWTANGHPYIFSIMINDILGKPTHAKRIEEKIVFTMHDAVK